MRDRLTLIQNSYNLLDRRCDSELSEACDRHVLGLPCSVPAGGLPSGKDGAVGPGAGACRPLGTRASRAFPMTCGGGTVKEETQPAREAGTMPSKLAFSFVRSREYSFVLVLINCYNIYSFLNVFHQ